MSANLLWIFLIIVSILLLVLLIIGICQKKIFNQNEVTTTTLPNTCEQQSTAGLIDVSQLPCCCSGNGFGGQSKFLPGYNMIISPGIPNSFLNVCVGYCDNYDSETNTCTSASNPQAQLQFNQCVDLLKPNNCNGAALPIGYSGPLFYYAQLANVPPCNQTWDCVNIELCN